MKNSCKLLVVCITSDNSFLALGRDQLELFLQNQNETQKNNPNGWLTKLLLSPSLAILALLPATEKKTENNWPYLP